MKILITGAAGRIGTVFYNTASRHNTFVLADIVQPNFKLREGDTFVKKDMSNLAEVEALVTGMDAVIHLSGYVDTEASFEKIEAPNFVATKNLIMAASAAGCKRFVFASSAQAIEGYPLDYQIRDGDAPRPANPYGVAKAYGEALCAYYAHMTDMSCVSLRIGAFEPEGSEGVANARDLSAWLSHRDGAHLIERALLADLKGSFVAHGISDNRFKRMELTATQAVLGYKPQDDAFKVFASLASRAK